MQKIAVFVLSLSTCLLLGTSQVSAAPTIKSPSVSASVLKSRKSLSTTFLNLSNTKTITYNLTYDSLKGKQGARGTIKVKPNTKTLSRSILFGTCSKKVCTYHKNIKNIKLSVDFTLKNGGIVSYEKSLK